MMEIIGLAVVFCIACLLSVAAWSCTASAVRTRYREDILVAGLLVNVSAVIGTIWVMSLPL